MGGGTRAASGGPRFCIGTQADTLDECRGIMTRVFITFQLGQNLSSMPKKCIFQWLRVSTMLTWRAICIGTNLDDEKRPRAPGTSLQNHDASGWGSSKMGTLSQWHYDWAPHLSQFQNPPPSPATQWAENQPTYAPGEDSLFKGEQEHTIGRTNRHTHPAFMATPREVAARITPAPTHTHTWSLHIHQSTGCPPVPH